MASTSYRAAARYRRRVTRTFGVAAGGLLGVACLPAAVAFADEDYGIYFFSPNSTDLIADGGVRNLMVGTPPAEQGSVQGIETFDVDNASGTQVGTVDADVTNATDDIGDTNQLILVTSVSPDSGYTDADLPAAGSVFDTDTSSGIQSIYSDIPSTTPGGTDLISYSFVTPFGDFNLPTSYDSITSVVPVTVAAPGAFDGDTFNLSGSETVGGVNGVAPADYDLLGTQAFDVDNAAGDPIGSFTADVANSSDILGSSTQDLLVTSSTGDAPAVGSVYDYFFLPGSGDDYYNVYSDIPSTTPGGADAITDTIVTPYGDLNVPTTFDAAAGLAGVLNHTSPLGTAIDLPNAYDITPVAGSTGTIVAIDGIAPEGSDVQGTQLFDYDPATGPAGTFDADVGQSVLGATTQEQLVVTSSTAGAPADGSVFDIYNYGGGYETIYSDIASTTGGSNTITDTVVTPFGDFNIPNIYDATTVLAADSSQNFADPAASSTLGADLLNMLDPSAVSGADPSAALEAGSFIDLFPNLDAALNLLAGLF